MAFGERPQKDHPHQQSEEEIAKELLAKATHHKGWLKKKSPALLKSWQDRYFMIMNNGQQFAYFDDDKLNSKLKGSIETSSIISIKSNEKGIFVVQFPGRDFELKAKNHDECLQWMKFLQISKDHAVQEVRQNTRLKSEDSVIKIEEGNAKKHDKAAWRDVDATLFQQIQAEKEKEIAKDEAAELTQNRKVSKPMKDRQVALVESGQMLEMIGLNDYIKRMQVDFISNRMICGYIGKRSKGKVKFFQKRWFLIISAKPLNAKEYNDEKILDETQLPPWMEIDTLYYFSNDKNDDKTRPKGDIKMFECQEIIIKNMQESKEKGFSFKLNMGDRLFHLMTDNESDRIKWSTALSSSMFTSKEIKNPLKVKYISQLISSQLKIVKNIDPILRIYDQEQSLITRREKLKEKFDIDYYKIKDETIGDEYYDSNFEYLLKFLTPLSKDMLDTMNGCVVKDPQRKDLIKEYIDHVHEKICEMITEFWDKSHETVDSVSLLKLSDWMNKYSEQLKDFFEDDRIIKSIRTLLGIYINRSIESVESVVQGIIDYEKTSEPFLNESEQLVSQTPIDLFKIINEGYDLAYNMCRTKETVLKAGLFAKTIIAQYQNGIEELMDEAPLRIDQYSALCNNTVSLSNYTKQLTQRLKVQGITDEEVDKVFDQAKITKKFVSISNIAKDRFFNNFFGGTQKFFKMYYLDIKLEDILAKLTETAHEPIGKLHDSFSRKIWKQFLDVLILFYFNCLIVSCTKAKKDHLDDFVEKLERDKEHLQQEFESFLFESQLTASLKPFVDMAEFLQTDSLSIMEPCKNLRIFFGRAFNDKTIKNIMHIRFDLDKDRKKDTIEGCKELIDDYNKHNKDDETTRLVDVLGMDEDDNPQEEEKKNAIDENVNRRAEMTLDDDPEDLEQDLIQKKHHEEEQKVEFIEEGYLYKKTPKEKDFLNTLMVNPMKKLVNKWDHRLLQTLNFVLNRFMRLKKGQLYWYTTERSREAQNKLDLVKIDDIVAHPTKEYLFTILLEGGKKYKFKAENRLQRDLWVKSIIKEQQKLDQASIQKIDAFKAGEGKKPIIKDYDEIARKEREKQKAEERRKKRQEREAEQKRKLLEQKKQQSLELQGLSANKDGTSKQTSTALEIQTASGGNTLTCWQQFMICIGVERAENFQTQQDTTQ